MYDYNDSGQESTEQEIIVADGGGEIIDGGDDYQRIQHLTEKHDLQTAFGTEAVYRRANSEAEFVREMMRMTTPPREVTVEVPPDVAEAAQRQVDNLVASSDRELDEEERVELFEERLLENLRFEFDVEYEL